jgi:hypothetical protein
MGSERRLRSEQAGLKTDGRTISQLRGGGQARERAPRNYEAGEQWPNGNDAAAIATACTLGSLLVLRRRAPARSVEVARNFQAPAAQRVVKPDVKLIGVFI